MEIQIKATEHVTEIQGVPCRLWEGQTSSGVKCKVFVHRIMVHKDEDASEFEKELVEQMPPAIRITLSDIL